MEPLSPDKISWPAWTKKGIAVRLPCAWQIEAMLEYMIFVGWPVWMDKARMDN